MSDQANIWLNAAGRALLDGMSGRRLLLMLRDGTEHEGVVLPQAEKQRQAGLWRLRLNQPGQPPRVLRIHESLVRCAVELDEPAAS